GEGPPEIPGDRPHRVGVSDGGSNRGNEPALRASPAARCHVRPGRAPGSVGGAVRVPSPRQHPRRDQGRPPVRAGSTAGRGHDELGRGACGRIGGGGGSRRRAGEVEVKEYPVFLPFGDEHLALVLTVPEGAPAGVVLLLTGGSAARSHRFQLWTRVARSLAKEHALASARLD